jgi:hypothetical protein
MEDRVEEPVAGGEIPECVDGIRSTLLYGLDCSAIDIALLPGNSTAQGQQAADVGSHLSRGRIHNSLYPIHSVALPSMWEKIYDARSPAHNPIQEVLLLRPTQKRCSSKLMRRAHPKLPFRANHRPLVRN